MGVLSTLMVVLSTVSTLYERIRVTLPIREGDHRERLR